MNIENNRLSTFENWPVSAPVDPIRIAKAGFFYTGEGTEVQCFSCGGKISEWHYGDQVMCRHRNLEPTCQFVLTPALSGNVPLVLGAEYAPQLPLQPAAAATNAHFVNENRENIITDEDEMYRSEPIRVLSLVNWNDDSVSPFSLASVGFYQTRGLLRCAWCGGELSNISNFGILGDPLQVHRRYFPRCAFAAGLEAETSRSGSPISPLPMSNLNWQPQTSGADHNAQVLATSGTSRALGVVGSNSRHPNVATVASRLATYHNWPVDRAQSPKVLAEAGFFYTGSDDQVRCFYCDGGLGRWEATDDPWTEHARWFPYCGFVLIVKGAQFIEASKQPTHGAGAMPRWLSAESRFFPVSEEQVTTCMESEICMVALGAGLDAARVRRAIVQRLRAAGTPYGTPESLIDAVLGEQLNEEALRVSPEAFAFTKDILGAVFMSDLPMRTGPPSQEANSNDQPSSSGTRSLNRRRNIPSNLANLAIPNTTTATSTATSAATSIADATPSTSSQPSGSNVVPNAQDSDSAKAKELQEENRLLREAKHCKVCMDNEVSVVFLPCGHLVTCGVCGCALAHCPLCRCAVKALVRAYLA